MKRPLLPLLLILLATSCGYREYPQTIALAAGETATVHVGYLSYGGLERPVVCFTSDPNVMSVSQGSNDLTVTVQALHPGVAYIQPEENPSFRLVTVTVFECPTLTVQPDASVVEARVGQPVALRVATSGFQELKTVWLLESPPGSWMIVNANGKSFKFTPPVSGTYHFRVEYNDRCGIATADIRVIASTRTRAVRH